jgi:hypothetical protein
MACALGLLGGGCHKEFTGPYECVKGYASCIRPDLNLCETNVQTDAVNCGGCSNGGPGLGATCPPGAACFDGGCGAAPTTLFSFPSASTLQSSVVVNATGVFWADATAISWLKPAATTPSTVGSGLATCGPSTVFAADTSSVYYVSNGFNCSQSGGCAGLVRETLSDSTVTVLVPSPMNGTTNVCATGIALSSDGSELYWLTSDPMNGSATTLTLSKVSLGGAAPGYSTVATAQSNGSSGLVVTPTAAIFEVSQANSQPSFEVVSIPGASQSSVPLPPNFGGFQYFTADSKNIYVIQSSCPCNGNGNGNGGASGLPVGTIGMVPIDGTPTAILAQVTGQAEGIALDPSNSYVYWSTDTAAWKVPVMGGTSAQIAGNLAGGVPAMLCTGCGTYNQALIALAVDNNNVYLADHAANVDALLEVQK